MPSTPIRQALPRHLSAALASPDNIWDAVKHPLRGVEVRAWLKKRPDWFLTQRGEWQETPLHWAAMADFGLLLEEIQAGLDPNALDSLERTPLDWLNDRLVAGTVLEPYRLPPEGRVQLLSASQDAGLVLWNHGGRPGRGAESLHAGRAWMSSGAWALLEMWDSQGPTAWHNWSGQGAGALHHWGVAPEGPDKDRWLAQYVKNGGGLDVRDAQGRTPLWYVADAIRARPAHAARLDQAWQSLLELGADPELTDDSGLSPLAMRAIEA